MAYVSPNFKTKNTLIEAIKIGAEVTVFSPGPFPVTRNGEEYIEGPHSPEPHRWYAEVVVKDGRVVKVK